MICPTKRLTVGYSPEDYETLDILAASKHCSKAELIRDFTLQGLKGELNANNIDFTTTIVREQIKNIIDPLMERMIALQAKSYYEAATASILSAETITKFVPLEYQDDFEAVYNKARESAIKKAHLKEN